MRGHAMLRAALTGLGLGAAWGVAARVFMRLVTTEQPSFSWAGTLGIIGLAAVLGAGVAVASEARLRRRRAFWWLALAPGLLLFAGPGMPFIPAFVLGGLLLRRRHVLARLGALVAIAGPGVAFWWVDRLDEVHMLGAPARVQAAELVVLPLLSLVLALAGDRLWGPRRVQSATPALGPRSDSPAPGPEPATRALGPQSASPDLALNSRRSDSSREVPAGPA